MIGWWLVERMKDFCGWLRECRIFVVGSGIGKDREIGVLRRLVVQNQGLFLDPCLVDNPLQSWCKHFDRKANFRFQISNKATHCIFVC